MTGRRTTAALTAVVLAVVGATGATVGVLVAAPSRPDVLADPAPLGVVPPAWRTFDDARTVEVALTTSDPVTLTAPVGGRVTGWECATGAVLSSGTTPLSVDGGPVLALATAVPLWRDLAVGDTGLDVAALQQALTDLGEPVPVDGRLGTGTLAAYGRVLAAAAPGGEPAQEVAATAVLWLPEPEVVVGACTTGTGRLVAAGDPLADTEGTPRALSLTRSPTDGVAGPRVLDVEGVRLDLDDALTLTDPVALAALARTAAYAAHVASPDTVPLTATWALAEPVAVAAVPPGALSGIEGVDACVGVDGRAVPVRLVSSDLGQALVTFPGEEPDLVDVAAPEGATCR